MQSLRRLTSSTSSSALRPRSLFVVRGYATRRYTPEHEWISLNKEGTIGTVGISDYAQKALGDVVFVEVPAVGTQLEKKDPLGAVESVKAASDIYAPVSGEVIESNTELEKEPTLINVSPFEKGWVCKIKLSNPAEVEKLLDEAAYAKHTSE